MSGVSRNNPTNNSTGEPVDLNKVEQIEEEVREES